MVRNKIEQEKENRIFESYKRDLEKLGKQHGQLRMINIEYLCSFPKIDPYKMATTLALDGFHLVFDDSSISREENDKKRKKVEDMVSKQKAQS